MRSPCSDRLSRSSKSFEGFDFVRHEIHINRRPSEFLGFLSRRAGLLGLIANLRRSGSEGFDWAGDCLGSQVGNRRLLRAGFSGS